MHSHRTSVLKAGYVVSICSDALDISEKIQQHYKQYQGDESIALRA